MTCQTIESVLTGNSYPGRGIIAGRSADGSKTVFIYFIMGRSENSRNRIFEETDDGIRTRAFDEAKMTDPSLVIYNPVRMYLNYTIVTNGDQTDTISDFLVSDYTFRDALLTREFEPDAPNYTPRISAIIYGDGKYDMSILKSMRGNPECCCRYFFEYDRPVSGLGHFISTYECAGSPLPSFEGEPIPVAIDCDLRELAKKTWRALDADNKVSLYAREINISTGISQSLIINKYTQR